MSAAARRRADLAVAVAAIAAFLALLWLGRGLTFFADEWAVIADRRIDLPSFLEPFNEHWLGVTVVVHRALVELVGLGSYLPYLGLLAALHVVVAAEVYVLVRRRTLPLVAAGIAFVVLFFGSGFENLFWAMQIGFVGGVALGLGALVLLDDPAPGTGRAVAATVLLALAVMTSGFGLFVLAFVGLDLLLDARRRRLLPAALVPAAIYLAWYLTLGRAGVARTADPFTVDALLGVPGFVAGGVASAFGAALGFGQPVGAILAVAVVVWMVVRTVRGEPPPSRALAAFGAIVAMYALLGLVRSQLEVDAALYTRYTYLSGILALIGLASLVGGPAIPEARGLRLAAVAVGGLVVALSLGWNLRLLVEGRALFGERADLTRALVEVALTEPLPGGVDPDLSLVLVPSPADLRTIVAAHGSPLGEPIPIGARAEALRRARDREALLNAPENRPP